MSWREVGWGIFLVGLPFAHLLVMSLVRPDDAKLFNIWHVQTTWAQVGVMGAFGLGFFGAVRRCPVNAALGCLALWLCGQTMWLFQYVVATARQFPDALMAGFLNHASAFLFILSASTQWTERFLSRLLRWVARAGLVVIGYAFLQWLNLDQFYRFTDWTQHTDTVMGTIGNSTHFGIYLALLLPLMLLQRGWRWRMAAIADGVLIVLTGSATAAACAIAALLWWGAFFSKRLVALACAILLVGGAYAATHPKFLDPSGRVEVWKLLWRSYEFGSDNPLEARRQGKTITGSGAGYLRALAPHRPEPLTRWAHAHNEYFQALIELGVIGLGLILWVIVDSWRMFCRAPKTPLAVALGGVWLVFLLSSAVSFSAHLWLLASFGLIAYCGIMVLSETAQG